MLAEGGGNRVITIIRLFVLLNELDVARAIFSQSDPTNYRIDLVACFFHRMFDEGVVTLFIPEHGRSILGEMLLVVGKAVTRAVFHGDLRHHHFLGVVPHEFCIGLILRTPDIVILGQVQEVARGRTCR